MNETDSCHTDEFLIKAIFLFSQCSSKGLADNIHRVQYLNPFDGRIIKSSKDNRTLITLRVPEIIDLLN